MNKPALKPKKSSEDKDSELFGRIFAERIRAHKQRNTIYLNDFNDIFKGAKRLISGSMFAPITAMQYPLPPPSDLANIEFVFIHVFLSKLYFDSHYMVIKSYCARHKISFFIPPISDSDASFKNGLLIFETLKKRLKDNGGKKFILIGMSKGAIDAMDSIIYSAETLDFSKKNILGLVSIGGSIGGSLIADVMFGKALKYLPRTGYFKSYLARGIYSMRTDIRKIRNFHFEKICPPQIKLYSISFRNKSFIKSILGLPTWFLSRYQENNDGFLLQKHSKIPGGVDLGDYEGDHSALLPFFNQHHIELFEAILIYLKHENTY